VRKVVCQDWITLDLKAAQFAICATVWNVPIAREFLESGQSVWTYLLNELALAASEDHKAGLKRMLYALLFGGYRNRAIERARKELLPDYPDLTARFFEVPLINALYTARRMQMRAITEAGGAKDAFGNWIPLPYDDGKPNARSVLACQAQSYEMKLLWPVFETARTSKDFDIVLYLFDGMCIATCDKRRDATIVQRLRALVDRQAAMLGIVTTLEGP
jgi:hypothetical protein